MKWYRKAAEQGHAEAQFALGGSYGLSEVQQDYVNAYAWWTIAAVNGHDISKESKPLIATAMTPELITEAQELSKEMIAKNPKLINKKN